MIVPEWNMVVVRMDDKQDMPDEDLLWEGFFKKLWPGIGPACHSK